eukprot:scaffold250982_cov55-Attheya_sp.AAC.1
MDLIPHFDSSKHRLRYTKWTKVPFFFECLRNAPKHAASCENLQGIDTDKRNTSTFPIHRINLIS